MKPKIGSAWQGDWKFPRTDPTAWIPIEEEESYLMDKIVFVVAVVIGFVSLFFVQ